MEDRRFEEKYFLNTLKVTCLISSSKTTANGYLVSKIYRPIYSSIIFFFDNIL